MEGEWTGLVFPVHLYSMPFLKNDEACYRSIYYVKNRTGEFMREILVRVPEWVDEDFIKLQIERIISIEKRRRELIEETLGKLAVDEEDLKKLERVREDVWREEKKRLGL
ncbi:hypothetical protein [Candidatus Pyrohabitans sp.]